MSSKIGQLRKWKLHMIHGLVIWNKPVSVHMFDHLNKSNSLFFTWSLISVAAESEGVAFSWHCSFFLSTWGNLLPRSSWKLHMPNNLTLTIGKVTTKTYLKHPREVDMRSLGKLDMKSNLLVFPSPKAGFILSCLGVDVVVNFLWNLVLDLTMIVPFGCSLFSHLFPTQSVSSVLM